VRIAIFGLGYVGVSAAACLAEQGHDVVGVDVSESKVSAINSGEAPIVEPRVAEMLRQAVSEGRLSATSVVGAVLDETDIAFVCVGTPSAADGSHNMSYIVEVSRQLASAIKPRSKKLTVVYRSTIKPGTTEKLVQPIFAEKLGAGFAEFVELVYNPEFLREGSAVADYFEPPKIVIGTIDGRPSENMNRLYADFKAPTFVVPVREAEIIKFVDNSWHALKVAYANEVGRVCHALDIRAETVHEIFKADTKLNISAYYTRPGGAFGGSCLPKDVRAFLSIAAESGVECGVLQSIMPSNEEHKAFQFSRVEPYLAPDATVLLVGLAFKANTDDLRESPNIDLAGRILKSGARLEIYDPAIKTAQLVGQNLGYAFGKLPSLSKIIVSKAQAESAKYKLVIYANRAIAGDIRVNAETVVDLTEISQAR
jgi:GDP-mannose 6-dehydrogenase